MTTAQVTGQSLVGVSIQAVVGQPFSGKVAALWFPVPPPQGVLEYAAAISWGDGASSAGTFADNAQGNSDVLGTHTYVQAGTFPIHVTVTAGPRSIPGSPSPEFATRIVAEVDSTATVTAAQPSGQPVGGPSSQPAAPAAPAAPVVPTRGAQRLSGTLQGGIVGIGGETTGWVLQLDTGGSIDVDVRRVRRVAGKLAGQHVLVTGRVVTVNHVERGPTPVLLARGMRS